MALISQLNYTSITANAVADQSPVAATLTQINGSKIALPADASLKVGTRYTFKAFVAKTAAGTATSAYHVRLGVLGTTADAAVLTFTKPVGDATADEGIIEIDVFVRTAGATGVLVGEFRMTHNLAATGHMTIPAAAISVVSAATDLTVASLIISVSVTSGAADALTFHSGVSVLTLM